jgi:hypothetical protein
MSMDSVMSVLSDKFEPPPEGKDALLWNSALNRIKAVGLDHKVSQAVMKKYKDLYGEDLVKGIGESKVEAPKTTHKMSKTAAKEKVASMSMEDKFKHAINTLKRKLKESKGDEAIAKKLAAYESQLKKIQGITAA